VLATKVFGTRLRTEFQKIAGRNASRNPQNVSRAGSFFSRTDAFDHQTSRLSTIAPAKSLIEQKQHTPEISTHRDALNTFNQNGLVIALAQMDVIEGNIAKNKKTMLNMVQEAKTQGADLVVFPEMCAQGYLVGDEWLSDDFCRNAQDIAEDIRQASEGIAIAWGDIYLDEELEKRTGDKGHHPNQDGRIRRYNGIYIVQDKQAVDRLKETPLLPKGLQPKTLLPNYRMFDDKRYFFSLKDVAEDAGVSLKELIQPFMIKNKVGQKVPVLFEVCEDLWAKDYRKNGQSLNVTKMGVENGAKCVVNLSASPWTIGKHDARDRRVKYVQNKIGNQSVPFLYANRIGCGNTGKNYITFDGGSTVYNSQGEPVQRAPEAYEEALIFCDTNEIDNASPVSRHEKLPIAEKYEAILEGIRSIKNARIDQKTPKFVIGLSGGIDSAVVCSLLVEAVGKENVVAVNMPTQWNSEATKNSAALQAQALGIEYHVVPIPSIVDPVEKALTEHFFGPRGETLTDLAKENIQAKIRGTEVLSNIAGNQGWIFTNNGNKLEVALGYATLYGDVGGAIAPIADLLKTEVWALAQFLNQHIYGKEVILNDLIPDELYRFTDDQIKPSAELEQAQEDPMKFGYHDALLALMTDYQKWSEEKILRAHGDGTLHQSIGKALGQDDAFGLALMKRWGMEKPNTFVDDLRWFISSIKKNVFKRVQAPGIIITSRSAFGYDIRESILPYYESGRLQKLRNYLLQNRLRLLANTYTPKS